MARIKEFDRDATLQRAIEVFSQHGYEGTSTQMLLDAMGVSRQSLYDTYGDKWRLYLECLQRYVSDSVGGHLLALESGSGVAAIDAFLTRAVDQARAPAEPACLGVGAICEFGRGSAEVLALTETSTRLLTAALARRLSEVLPAPTAREVEEGADFLMAAVTGIKVAARAGMSRDKLLCIARRALRAVH